MAKLKAERIPDNNIEWQAAADAAEMLLSIDAARQYGLVDQKMQIDVGRCRDVLMEASLRDITPRPGPGTNGGLLAKLLMPGVDPATLPKSRKKPNAAIHIEIRAQRMFGVIPDAKAVIKYLHPKTKKPLASIRVNDEQLQVHLVAAERYYAINIIDLAGEVVLGDGSYDPEG